MKIGIAIVAIAIVALGAWYVLARPAAGPTSGYATPTTAMPTNTDAGAPTPGATNAATLSPGTSNTNLDANLQQVDTGLQGASTDSASVGASLNDQMVPQSE
jgi:hypothetical protein